MPGGGRPVCSGGWTVGHTWLDWMARIRDGENCGEGGV